MQLGLGLGKILLESFRGTMIDFVLVVQTSLIYLLIGIIFFGLSENCSTSCQTNYPELPIITNGQYFYFTKAFKPNEIFKTLCSIGLGKAPSQMDSLLNSMNITGLFLSMISVKSFNIFHKESRLPTSRGIASLIFILKMKIYLN